MAQVIQPITNLLARELKSDLTGDDIRALQAKLAQLGLSIPDSERQAGLFGAGTLAVVQSFQKQHSLPVTGVVDSATAAEIDRQAAAHALAVALYAVAGHVYAGRAGTGGLAVQVVDKNAGPDVVLIQGTTDASGAYMLQYP